MLPIIFQNNYFVIYSYPLFMGLGWGVAYQLFFNRVEKQLPLNKAQFIFWGLFLSSWLGAKLMFFITSPSDLNLLSQISFWTGGGFVFYGGLILGLLFLGLFKQINPEFQLRKLSPILPAMALGHGIGRLGCFLAGCCFGSPTDKFWGLYMHGDYRHPTQLFESMGLFAIAYILLRWTQKNGLEAKSLSFYLISYGALRLFIEGLRGDVIRGVWLWATPSQWISVGLILAGLGLVARLKSMT